MPGVVFSLVLSFMVAGTVWLLFGARVQVSREPEQNSMLNFFLYLLITLPFAIAIAFYVLQ